MQRQSLVQGSNSAHTGSPAGVTVGSDLFWGLSDRRHVQSLVQGTHRRQKGWGNGVRSQPSMLGHFVLQTGHMLTHEGHGAKLKGLWGVLVSADVS